MHPHALLVFAPFAPHFYATVFLFSLSSKHGLASSQEQLSAHPRTFVQQLGGSNQTPLNSKGSPTNATARAELAFSSLQTWYNPSTGLWNSTGWWNSANILTTIGNLAKQEPENVLFKDMVTRIFANTVVRAPASNPQPGIEDGAPPTGYAKRIDVDGRYVTAYPDGWLQNHKLDHVSMGQKYDFLENEQQEKEKETKEEEALDPKDWLNGYYDDDLWWALAWINAYDLTSHTPYLDLAAGIFATVTHSWPTRCYNGGIYWSVKKDYVNAIANELFFSTAAHLANRAESRKDRDGYLDWATRSLGWFLESGMVNARGTVNDGLTEGCANNGRPTWSYNQGVILGGLVELHTASPSPSPSYLALASRIAKAALAELQDDKGVMHDVCEPQCGADGTQFKGVFMRNLQVLHGAAPDAMYAEAIRVNAHSIWENDREAGNRCSVDWAGPFVEPANASTQSSAMDALVADVAVEMEM